MQTILLVEDEALIAMNEAHMLKRHGFEVIKAHNAKKAIESVKRNSIDLILMDIDLGPGKMDGTEAAQIILKDHDLPVVFLSSHTEPEVVEKTEKITAYGYVVKNSGETVLINSIKMAFKLHNSLQKEKEREQLMSTMIAASPVAIHGIDPEGNIILWNESSEKVFGWKTDEVLGKPLPIVPEDKKDEHHELRARTLSGETIKRREVIRFRKNGERFYGSLSTAPLYNDEDEIFGIVAIMEDISERKEIEQQLENTIERLNKQKQELQILYQASKAVLEPTTFKETSQKLFNLAKEATGATAGYVALLSEDGSENEVLFLDDGGFPCKVDPNLPMPIRGVRAEAYHSGKAVVNNNFMKSEFVRYMPKGHVVLKNVLFAPLPIEGKVVGIIGLANKEVNFTSRNAEIAEGLGTIAAIALKNSRSKELLKARETSLTEALDEKDYLMRELNHRVKNNLSMVSSLINLKESALEKTELSDLRNQIEAIQIVHDKLYRTGEVTHIDFKDYISDLLNTIFSSLAPSTVHIEEDIEDISIHTKMAVPLGIIINELATNAIKHGFTSEEKHKFMVMMNEDSNKKQYILTVSNTGRPFPKNIDLNSPGTLGLQLVSALVEQIDGTIELQKEPHPVFTIQFPMEKD